MGVIGTLDDTGAIIEEADECAATGRPVLGKHSYKRRLDGTHFIRVLSAFRHLLTESRVEELIASLAVQQEIPAEPPQPEKPIRRRGADATEEGN